MILSDITTGLVVHFTMSSTSLSEGDTSPCDSLARSHIAVALGLMPQMPFCISSGVLVIVLAL